MDFDMKMFFFTLAVGFFFGGMLGVNLEKDAALNRCEMKYGDMPANKVQQHCKELLEFK